MIAITPQDIQDAGGLPGALSRASVGIVRRLLRNTRAELPPQAASVERLLAHKHPHLDEYMAMLLFKAALPKSRDGLPLGEIVLRSLDNDAEARAAWPSSAIFGMGGTNTGGARGLLVFDEHIRPGQEQEAGSVTMLVRQQLFGAQALPTPLSKLCRETDHIDAYGNAHFKHLGNYIKRVHEAEFLFPDKAAADGADSVLPGWKQALAEACIAAVLCALQEKKRFMTAGYWREPVVASLNRYATQTRLREDADFGQAFQKLKRNICGFKGAKLRIKQPDGSLQQLQSGPSGKDGQQDPWQLLVMPYIAALCQEYWGEDLGQLILSLFWEARILGDMGYAKIYGALEQLVAAGESEQSADTPVGTIHFRQVDSQAPDATGTLRRPWILELRPAGRLANCRAPLTSYLKNNNGGVGYTLVYPAEAGGVVLSKGAATDPEEWQKLVAHMLESEGNADEGQGGCWHVVQNANGHLADYLLNGNPAHQYVPRTRLTAASLAEILAGLR